jgi:hypothetical protein
VAGIGEYIPGLKPDFVMAPSARTKVRAYLRSNGNSKSGSNDNSKSGSNDNSKSGSNDNSKSGSNDNSKSDLGTQQ